MYGVSVVVLTASLDVLDRRRAERLTWLAKLVAHSAALCSAPPRSSFLSPWLMHSLQSGCPRSTTSEHTAAAATDDARRPRPLCPLTRATRGSSCSRLCALFVCGVCSLSCVPFCCMLRALRGLQLVIATFAGYVATYGLIKIAMGNPKPQKVKKEKGMTRHDNTQQASAGTGDRHHTAGRAALGQTRRTLDAPDAALAASQAARRWDYLAPDIAAAIWIHAGACRIGLSHVPRPVLLAPLPPSALALPHAAGIALTSVFSLFRVRIRCAHCSVVKVEVAPVTSGYQAPTAENIGTWLENPANISAWEKSLQ